MIHVGQYHKKTGMIHQGSYTIATEVKKGSNYQQEVVVKITRGIQLRSSKGWPAKSLLQHLLAMHLRRDSTTR